MHNSIADNSSSPSHRLCTSNVFLLRRAVVRITVRTLKPEELSRFPKILEDLEVSCHNQRSSDDVVGVYLDDHLMNHRRRLTYSQGNYQSFSYCQLMWPRAYDRIFDRLGKIAKDWVNKQPLDPTSPCSGFSYWRGSDPPCAELIRGCSAGIERLMGQAPSNVSTQLCKHQAPRDSRSNEGHYRLRRCITARNIIITS